MHGVQFKRSKASCVDSCKQTLTIEFKTNIDCTNRKVTVRVKHLESGIEAESKDGDNEREMQRQALIELAHRMGKVLERNNYNTTNPAFWRDENGK